MATAEQVLDVARGEIGVTEFPPGSNKVKYNEWYYGRPVSGSAYPWCMAFVQWCMTKCGMAVPVRTASCGSLMRAAKKAGQWVTKDFAPGDVLIYDFPGGSGTDHTGICESAGAQKVTAIEGNTSVSNASNGGEVRRMTRSTSLVVGAWRPAYEPEKEEDEMKYYKTEADIPSWYAPTIRKLIAKGALQGDGNGELNISEETCRLVTVLDRLGKLD